MIDRYIAVVILAMISVQFFLELSVFLLFLDISTLPGCQHLSDATVINNFHNNVGGATVININAGLMLLRTFLMPLSPGAFTTTEDDAQ